MTRIWIPSDFSTEDVLRLMDRLGVDDTCLWFNTKLGQSMIRMPAKEGS